ncbi:MAG: hypothetical protein RMJ82_12790 [Gemmatales bacterium]|nr:hypothetical protein [Gemmatales bacterium]
MRRWVKDRLMRLGCGCWQQPGRTCLLAGWILIAWSLWAAADLSSSSPSRSTSPNASALRQAYRQFLQMPPEQRRRLLQFDQALREEDAATQARLIRLMVRYCEWLERLTPEERAYLDQATDDADKLARVRVLKEQQWIYTLPRADQVALSEARQRSESEYRQLLERLRDREKQLDWEWNLAAAPAEDPELVRTAITRWVKQLKPHLTTDEAQLLAEAQKRGRPPYLWMLAELSERHQLPIPQELHRLRLVYPPVSQSRLWQFLRNELDSATRAEFEKRFRDPAERELALADLVRTYWQAHRQELQRLREQELRRLRDKPKPSK